MPENEKNNEPQEIKEKNSFEAPRVVAKPDSSKKPKSERPKKNKPSGKIEVVAVSFHKAGKIYDFDTSGLKVNPGDQVIVETEEGLGLARVVVAARQERLEELEQPLKKLLRKTTYDDIHQHEKNVEREKRAYEVCQEKIKQYQLGMKLVHVEYLHSGSKAIFYFTSEQRVDFRQLVRELAHEFHTRIEMRQIGPRDESKFTGGIGVCGRELCCSTWLRDFDPISIKMAKEQELSLNPSKLAGQCGRLKCCLAYEYETYIDLKKGLPKIGKKVCWKDGSACGKITGHNIFNGMVKVEIEEGTEKMISAEEIKLAPKEPKTPTPPPE